MKNVLPQSISKASSLYKIIIFIIATKYVVEHAGYGLKLKGHHSRVCSNYRGIALLSLHGKVYSRVLNLGFRRRVVFPRPWNSGTDLYSCREGILGV